MIKNLLNIRGIQIIILVGLYLLFADQLPLKAHQTLYTISICIKDLLVGILPLTVGFFIAHAICGFRQKAPLFIFALILFETLSNLSSVWYAYAGGHLTAGYLPPVSLPESTLDFSPLWRVSFSKPSWWSPEKGTLAGLLFGFIAAFYVPLQQEIQRGKKLAEWILTRVFSRLIPLFILGFIARMHQTKLLQHMLSHYSLLLCWLVVFLAGYIALLFLAGSGWSLKAGLKGAKNLMPAGAIAFTSGCSLSTMPWTIEGTSKNLNDPELAKAVIPATTNIQQIGDCIANTFLCFLIYRHFFGVSPDIATWASFSAIFVLARFATAAMLGGAIFIMLPIYESHLSFNAEMIAIILAFNVVLDPLITSCNVVANGALCRIFEKTWRALLKRTEMIKNQGR